MSSSIILDKMHVENTSPIGYSLSYNDHHIHFNSYLNKAIQIIFNNEIFCTSCHKKTKKSFMNGFCFRCFQTAPEASACVLRPELCEAHLGKGRDLEWEQQYHNQPHIVYLSFTGNLKVGVTRKTNTISRWIDQGALAAIELAQTPNRYLAGCIEVALKGYFSDKTSWQAMLKKNTIEVDLVKEKEKALSLLTPNLQHYGLNNTNITEFKYPKLETPSKIKSLTLDKNPIITGTLTGIKGQYLYLDNEFVFNVRRHSGYKVLFNQL